MINNSLMYYFKKNVRYLKFFEDIKIIQNDEHNARIAIVFCGKERLVHIFDSSPYCDYIPIKIKDKTDLSISSFQSQDFNTINNPPAAIDNPLQRKDDVDIKKLFEDISTDHQLLAPQIILQNNQQYIIFNQKQIQKPILPEHQFELSKFDLFFEATIKKIEIKLDIKKPKIKSRLLSVIQTNTIRGIEWFAFQKDTPLLLIVNIDNYIGVYKRRSVDNNKRTEINNAFLQNQPFSNFPEDWSIFCSASQSIPIKDYYLKPSGENVFKLYTIHANNSISFWFFFYQSDALKITPNFIVSFDPIFIIDNIVVNSNETFLYCFNSKGMQIYKISSAVPFPLVYLYWYDEANAICDKKKGIERLIPLSFSSFSEGIDEDIIDLNENVTREELKFFKDLQKPIFSMIENVLFIELYNSHTNEYSLMCFDTQGLSGIFKDINFFEKCRKGDEKTLMKKFFVSKNNFSFALSPNLYLKKNNQENSLSLNSEITKDDILLNLHQILIISNGNSNTFYSIPAIMNNELITTPTVLDSFKITEGTEEDDEGDGNNYKIIIQWIEKNTIIMTSLKFLFTIVKYCNEMNIFGMPISYNKLKLILFN